MSLAELNACCDSGGGTSGVARIVAGNGISIAPSTGTGTVTVSTSGSAGGSGGVFPPMMRDFRINVNASNKTCNAFDWAIINNDANPINNRRMTVSYPAGWTSKPCGEGSIVGVMKSETESVQMPAGANAAIVVYGGSVLHAASDDQTARSVHTAHRLTIRSGAKWVDIQGQVRNDYISSSQKSIVYINDANARDEREHARTFKKLT